jgi:hypothetical protein
MCKTRVDALSYRNNKSRVDAPSASELMLLELVIRNRIKACNVWWCVMWFEMMFVFVCEHIGMRLDVIWYDVCICM